MRCFFFTVAHTFAARRSWSTPLGREHAVEQPPSLCVLRPSLATPRFVSVGMPPMHSSPSWQQNNIVRCRDEASLNIIIPMGGSGEAFKAAGFMQPKPMIKVAGRPLLLHLLDSLRLRLGDVVWLIIPSAVYRQFQSQLDFKTEYPQADIRVCEFTVLTRGAVETIYIGLQHMTSAELSRRALVLDCDNLYFADVLSMFRAAPTGRGMCAYFIDRGTAALYSLRPPCGWSSTFWLYSRSSSPVGKP